MTPDLSALSAAEAWEHFGTVRADALAALRERMGEAYADTPTDGVLEAALVGAVAFLERATGRIFTVRTGTLTIDGTGAPRLFLPLPVVSEGQGGEGVTEITIGEDTTALDADYYTVNDGIGLPGRDPRDCPVIDLVSTSTGGESFTSRPPGWSSWSSWPRGVRNVNVTASWGYVDAAGETPELARQALALLTIRALTPADDPDAREDLRRGALVSESVQGRSYALAEHGTGAGLTTDRELDLLISALKAPPLPRIPSPPNRRRATTRTRLGLF